MSLLPAGKLGGAGPGCASDGVDRGCEDVLKEVSGHLLWVDVALPQGKAPLGRPAEPTTSAGLGVYALLLCGV